ncbi:C40 family peptidase [Bacillus velezensis]|uniref:C40 family peptidase n=1 Tax=Bacillus velezensis TaxID=492670 RepID=UPI00192B3350|nr:C40 family peptidase [Bacillus velezensis]QQY05059.1 C40 family peptidase [Bacillus velezensis]
MLTSWRKYILAGLMICLVAPAVTRTEIAEADSQVSVLMVSDAQKLVGNKYVYGGEEPEDGFDPSGLIHYLFSRQNIHLPRTVSDQWKIGTAVKENDLLPGDLVFFKKSDSTQNAPVHDGLYIGNGEMIHSSPSEGVTVTRFQKSSYWMNLYLGAKRITKDPELADDPIVQEAARYLDIPYVFGGSTPEAGFDCSGLVQYVFENKLHIYLPRSAEQQWLVGEKIKLSGIKPGDVIYFSDTYKKGISHAGIYAGEGRFIQASRSEKVTISYLAEDYWKKHFTGVRRFSNLAISKDNPVVSTAADHIGISYLKGGVSPETGFDTAGFVQYIYQKAKGISLPRYADKQMQAGVPVDKQDLKPGDLVFFKAESLNPAIYIGNGQVIHVTVSAGVTITNMNTSAYWKDKYAGGIRLP